MGHSTSSAGGSGGSHGVRDLGEPCSTGDECASSHCTDGVCCDTACDSICSSCNLSGTEGTCDNDPAGTDPANECVGEAACDGSGECLCAEHLWSKRFGSTSDDWLHHIAVDSQSNVVVVGTFVGSVNFGGATLTSTSGSRDIFVAKYDSDGDHLWSKRFGDGATNQGLDVLAIDGADNILVGGHFVGSLNLGGTNLVNADAGPDLCVAKFSPSGDHVWSKAFAVAGSSDLVGGNLHDLVTDNAGNIVFTGNVDNSVNFGGATLVATGPTEGYLAKLTPTGAHAWSRIFTGVGSQTGWSLATLSTNDVVLAGTFVGGDINPGGGPLSPVGADIFLARFSGTGSHMWSTRFGNDTAHPWSIAASSAGILMVGMFETSIDFGGGSMMSAGDRDAFAVVFSETGVHQWSKRYGSAARDVISSGQFDAVGNIVVSGYTQGSVDFDGGPLVSSGGDDVFVATLDSAGAHIWSRIFGAAGHETPEGLGVSGDGIFLGGSFEGAFNSGGGSLSSAGGRDVFLTALGP